jgi:hypothetical protein
MVYSGPSATFIITDNETGTSVTLRMNDSGSDEYGGDTDSPPPTTQPTTYKRAIVIHEVPQLDYDIGQDMGASATKKSVTANCQLAVRNQLIAWMGPNMPQFTSLHPSGRFSIVGTRRDFQQDVNIPNAAMESLSDAPVAGSYIWYKVTVGFVIVSSSQ